MGLSVSRGLAVRGCSQRRGLDLGDQRPPRGHGCQWDAGLWWFWDWWSWFLVGCWLLSHGLLQSPLITWRPASIPSEPVEKTGLSEKARSQSLFLNFVNLSLWVFKLRYNSMQQYIYFFPFKVDSSDILSLFTNCATISGSNARTF